MWFPSLRLSTRAEASLSPQPHCFRHLQYVLLSPTSVPFLIIGRIVVSPQLPTQVTHPISCRNTWRGWRGSRSPLLSFHTCLDTYWQCWRARGLPNTKPVLDFEKKGLRLRRVLSMWGPLFPPFCSQMWGLCVSGWDVGMFLLSGGPECRQDFDRSVIV